MTSPDTNHARPIFDLKEVILVSLSIQRSNDFFIKTATISYTLHTSIDFMTSGNSSNPDVPVLLDGSETLTR